MNQKEKNQKVNIILDTDTYPNINDDTSYKVTKDNRKVTVVNYLNVDKIYKDLFKKLGEN